MDRRDTLKTMILGAVAGGAGATMLPGCKTDPIIERAIEVGLGRTPYERERDNRLIDAEFLNENEMSLLTTLCDIILPASDTAGSASDADVPEFINFICKDMPSLKIPVQGGLAWMNNEAMKRFAKSFTDSSTADQMKIVDDIAYPEKIKDGMEQGAAFFDRLRSLTLTGYYTSRIGIKDLGYAGNRPNVWDGVPQDVLDKHGMSYDPEWLAKCVDQSQREVIAEWDDQGNLIT